MTEKAYIYLDSAATASDARFHVIDNFANPNSIHDAGRDAFCVLENARESIAKNIGAKRPSELIFTSGATESNNIAIFGIARACKNLKSVQNPKVLISSIEHESVLMPALQLKNEGFNVETIDVDNHGFIDIENAKNKIDKNTVLVSVQLANTEIATIQNLSDIVEIAHNYGVKFHSDCVGALGRIPIDVSMLNVDSASFAGHKIGTAKGIGAIYLKSKTPCAPLIFGSGQEKGIRGGTQNVAMAKSFSDALKYSLNNMNKLNSHYKDLKNYLYNEIQKIEGVRFTVENHPDSSAYLSNIVHLSFKNKTSESLILHYGKDNIIVSGGPACSAEDKKPSHVLEAIGIANDEIDGAIRISFLENTTKDDITAFIDSTKRFMNGG